MSTTKNLEELRKILTVEQLPAMPHSALSVLQLDNDLTKVDINDLVCPIEADPGLASQVLKFLNSSYFGFQSAISNVRQGIALVGIRVVKNFVLWKAIFSLIPKCKTSHFDISLLWQDSLRRAMFSRFLLIEIRKGDPELAFAASLLQDMAIPLLIKQLPQQYEQMMAELAANPKRRLSELETVNFSWTHADAGEILSKNWKLPDPLVQLIANHTNVEDYIAHFDKNSEQVVVSMSALLPSVTKANWDEAVLFMKNYPKMLGGRSLPIDHFFTKVDKEFEQYAAIIQISKPDRPLSDYLQ